MHPNKWILSDPELDALLDFVKETTDTISSDHLKDEELAAYAYGTASAQALEKMDRHLSCCNKCARKVETLITDVEAASSRFHSSEESFGNRWVEQWQQGIDHDESFRRIFHQYYRLVFSFFVKKGFSAEECNDLAQETFLRVHKSLGTFRREARFETWLFQISANIYRNTLRAQSTRKRDAPEVSLTGLIDGPGRSGGWESDIAQEEGNGPHEDLLASERSRILHEALQDLPSQMRRCVILRVDRNLKYREIADIMLVSVDTVKAHLFQARQLLKVRLADYFSDLKF